MTSPKRLRDEGSSFDRQLLHAGREEGPSRDLQRRILAAVSAMPVAEAAERSSVASRFAALARPRVLILATAIGIGAAMVAANERRGAAPSSPPSPSSSPTAAIAPPVPASDEPLAPVAVPVTGAARPDTNDAPPAEGARPAALVTPDALPSVRPAPPREAAPRPAEPTRQDTTAKEVAATPSLDREVDLLDGVKTSLKAGALPEATRALDAYDAEFPQGTLKPEAGVLRVRVLLAKGDRRAAASLAEELLRRHPNGVHAKRIRALLASDGGS